ncbi:HAMP domain-containing histidine kinase [Paenibacillus sedimenti]|uniref:histidine kinase n=1 Tax=Paenibacillus sedimenti TaxID=2770274 RepID=A0A926KUV3_9BACL|nr:HAMP domain-containing histidine kinase [Paenibacillus sedimenti]MBD0382415.1 HAMP domain-containing histidine kinase [Paenibacillus sedimenti]
MKLFFREQLPLIFVYFGQLFVIMLIYWLDGYRHIMISLYAALLSSCLLAGYLTFRYITNRTFYNRLKQPPVALEEYASPSQQAPLAEALQHLLKNQYRLYQNDLHHYQHKINVHTQFINQWVHQMKIPVSVIHLMIQDQDAQPFPEIGDELDKLRKGLEMVLYAARLDAFEHDFYVEALDMETIVRSVTSSQKRLFIRSGVFPFVQVEGEICMVSDEKWLSFAITQLITNAVRYTAGTNRKIYFRGYVRTSKPVLEIQDEGVGIPASDLPRVFDPYFTGENGRNFQESTGMGLYLVKQICDKLGHQVELESTVGQGTVVRIVF